MPVRPKKLQGIATDRLEAQQFESPRADLLDRAEHPSQCIRFALASGAGTGPPQQVQRQIQLLSLLEAESEFISDDGGVVEFAHAG
jgi:hypothetical protein